MYDQWRPFVPLKFRTVFNYYNEDPGEERRSKIAANTAASREVRQGRSITVDDGKKPAAAGKKKAPPKQSAAAGKKKAPPKQSAPKKRAASSGGGGAKAPNKRAKK